jgi:zinc transport system substrate-binding protein
VAVAVLLVVAAACASPGGERRTVVASFYPLAYAAERIAGPGWEVMDLTPPGTEAHDVELSLEDRAAIEDADVVVYLGDIGFQPQVEAAVEDARGTVVAAVTAGAGAVREDPHIWLSPRWYISRVVTPMLEGFPGDEYDRRYQELVRDLQELDDDFERSLAACRHDTIVVPHEAFGYLAASSGFRQFGLAGVTPEGEPTASRLAEARELIEDGSAGAVLYEAADDESRRTAETLAEDSGVPALPLSTLESEPPSGDYISVMEDNLESLRQGLGCE